MLYPPVFAPFSQMLLVALAGASCSDSATSEASTRRMLVDFRSSGLEWSSIDDRVMGGLSRSQMRVTEGLGRFTGNVSLDNGGGFASVRSRPEHHDLRAFDGIEIRVRGDGRTYGFRLRDTAAFDGVSYQVTLPTTEGSWSVHRFPFRSFRPVFRGRRVWGYPPVDLSRIRTFGFIIADEQEGPFALEIDSLVAYTIQLDRPESP